MALFKLAFCRSIPSAQALGILTPSLTWATPVAILVASLSCFFYNAFSWRFSVRPSNGLSLSLECHQVPFHHLHGFAPLSPLQGHPPPCAGILPMFQPHWPPLPSMSRSFPHRDPYMTGSFPSLGSYLRSHLLRKAVPDPPL